MRTVGILGGGQLGRMLALAGYPLGLRFRIIDPSPEAPAEHVAEFIQGEYDDLDMLSRFTDGLDVVTYEFENVPVRAVEHLANSVTCHPSATALATAQDRLSEKQLFSSDECNIPTPRYEVVDHWNELNEALDRIGLPAVLKSRRGGYDGKGQFVLRCRDDARKLETLIEGHRHILESFVPFDRELSLIGVRDMGGRTAFYPLVENHHAGGILRCSHAPAARVTERMQQRAEEHAARIMQQLNYVGVLAVEFFEVSGELLANEIAPRVHNSGHWTIEGATTSQFENHLQAILGLPLGATDAIGCSVMFNLIGALPDLRSLLDIRGAHVHLYGKSPRPGRKLGHVTVWAENETELRPHSEAVSRVIEDELKGRTDQAANTTVM